MNLGSFFLPPSLSLSRPSVTRRGLLACLPRVSGLPSYLLRARATAPRHGPGRGITRRTQRHGDRVLYGRPRVPSRWSSLVSDVVRLSSAMLYSSTCTWLEQRESLKAPSRDAFIRVGARYPTRERNSLRTAKMPRFPVRGLSGWLDSTAVGVSHAVPNRTWSLAFARPTVAFFELAVTDSTAPGKLATTLPCSVRSHE